MADLTIQEISDDGLNPTFAAAATGGDAYLNDERTFLVVKNGDTAGHTVTVAVQRTQFNFTGFGPVDFANLSVSIPAGEERWIAVPPPPYNDGNGKAQVTYDAVTSMTVAAIRLPRV